MVDSYHQTEKISRYDLNIEGVKLADKVLKIAGIRNSSAGPRPSTRRPSPSRAL